MAAGRKKRPAKADFPLLITHWVYVHALTNLNSEHAVQPFISYLRVSTQRQGQSGLGLEAQRQAVGDYVRSVGGEIVEEFVEVESGSIRDRPILLQSIALCKKQRAVLVLARLDRLARNVAFVSALMETGIEFVAVDAPFANKLLIHILSAFSEHERTLISERTKAALAAAKARGVRLGANGAELARKHKALAQQFAEEMRPAVNEAFAKGARTLAEVALSLNSAGWRTREGSFHSPGSVHRILKRLDVTTACMQAVRNTGGKSVRPISQMEVFL